MARKRSKKPQAAIREMLATAGIELATDLARMLLARKFPQLSQQAEAAFRHRAQLNANAIYGKRGSPARKAKRTEVDLGGGVFYTPARKKTT